MAYGYDGDLNLFENLSVSGNDEYRTVRTPIFCSSCKEAWKEVDAVRYCIDCEEYQCGKCGRLHDRYNNGHEVLGQWNEMRWGEKKATKLPTEKCQKHIGEVLQIYCENHEELCCHVCVAMEHSKCEQKKYIPDLAENITNDEEYKTLDADTTYLVTHLNAILLQSTTNRANVDNSLNRFDQCVKETRERLLKMFDHRANETRKQVAMECTRIASKIDSTMSWARAEITKVQLLQSKIDPQKVTNKSQLFINLKNVGAEFYETFEELTQVSNPQAIDIHFKLCDEITPLLGAQTEIVKYIVVTWTPNNVPTSVFENENAIRPPPAPAFGNTNSSPLFEFSNRNSFPSNPVFGNRNSFPSVPAFGNRNSSPSAPVFVSNNNSPSAPVFVSNNNSPSVPAFVSNNNSPSVPAFVSNNNSHSVPAFVSNNNSHSVPAFVSNNNSHSVPAFVSNNNSPSVPAFVSNNNSHSVPAFVSNNNSHSVPAFVSNNNSHSVPAFVSNNNSPSVPAFVSNNNSPSAPAFGNRERSDSWFSWDELPGAFIE